MATQRKPDSLTSSVDSNISFNRTLTEWREILRDECQVYVIDQNYIGKRFSEVCFKYMGVDEATEVLADNMYAILLYKYFPVRNDDVYTKIEEIIKSLTRNPKTFLKRITMRDNTFGQKMQTLTASQVAFTNGVFDFKENKFVLKFERILIPELNNEIVLYNNYIIEWNFDFDFEPLPFSIMDLDLNDYCELLKDLNKSNEILAWELFYNMSHDSNHRFDYHKSIHLAELLGYTMLTPFTQQFCILIGSGGNGKNSIIDGCLTAHAVPRPVNNSLEDIEDDQFVTGSLVGAHQNIFLETSQKTFTNFRNLKLLTGSQYQTVQEKCVPKYTATINCRCVWAGNSQGNIQFGETTEAMSRRVNILEIFYKWDKEFKYMKYGDYYKTSYSDDYREISNNITNVITYIYLGMFGTKIATSNFEHNFRFTENDYSATYINVNEGIKEYFEYTAEPRDFIENLRADHVLKEAEAKVAFLNEDASTTLASMKNPYWKDYLSMVKYLTGSRKDEIVDANGDVIKVTVNNWMEFLSERTIYISTKLLRAMLQRYASTFKQQRKFTEEFIKIYPNARVIQKNGVTYVRAKLIGQKIKFIG